MRFRCATNSIEWFRSTCGHVRVGLQYTVPILIFSIQPALLKIGIADGVENDQRTPGLIPLCCGKVSESRLSTICMMTEKTVAISTRDDVAIWTLESNGNTAKCEARAGISNVRDMHYLTAQDTLICAGSHLAAWRVGQNGIDVLGTLIPLKGQFPDCLSSFVRIAPTRDDQFIAASNSLTYPVVGRANDLQGAQPQAISSSFVGVAWKKDGLELFVIEWQNKDLGSEAIVLRTLSGLELGEPRSKFRTTFDDRTTEVTSDPSAQKSGLDLPIRSRINDEFGITTAFDSDHVFLSLYTDQESKEGRHFEDQKTHEIWDVTNEKKCELVRIFSEIDLGRERERGYYFVKCLAADASDQQNSSAHFIFVYERGMIDIKAAPGPLVNGIESSAFIPFPDIAAKSGQVGMVSAACISTDGLRIATAHQSGHVVIWSYSRNPNVE